LTNPPESFQLIFELYNFISEAKAQDDELDDPMTKLDDSRIEVDDSSARCLTGSKGSQCKMRDPEDDSSTGPHGRTLGDFREPSVRNIIFAAGYVLDEDVAGLQLVNPVSINSSHHAESLPNSPFYRSVNPQFIEPLPERKETP
jgi:hypothetical protein